MARSRSGDARTTFADILDANRGAGPGFDLLRFGLAISILASHCSGLTGNSGFLSHFIHEIMQNVISLVKASPLPGDPSSITASAEQIVPRGITGPARPYTLSRVPMFFALSGFLVMGSAFRTKKVLPFLGLRIIRIVPALSVEVVLSAIVLGAVYTSLPLHDYFSSSGFYSYFLNIFGIVHYTLPGVFENNISQVVNGNLWTLPAEFYSYAITAVLILSGVMFNRKLFTIIFVTATLPLIAINYATGFGETRIGLDGNVSVYYFFMGVFFYLWKDKIVYNKHFFFASLLLSYFLMMSNHAVFIYPMFLTYITIFIGLSPLPQPKLLKSGDYSYGIYLYGYPISQALVSSLPMIKQSLFGLLALAIIFTGIFSVFSWHVIEKRFLHLKKYLSPRSAEISAALHPTSMKGTEVREEAIPQTLRGSVP